MRAAIPTAAAPIPAAATMIHQECSKPDGRKPLSSVLSGSRNVVITIQVAEVISSACWVLPEVQIVNRIRTYPTTNSNRSYVLSLAVLTLLATLNRPVDHCIQRQESHRFR